MKKIGITGGIGSGKSTVSKLFEIMGFPVYTADIESKRLTETSPVIRQKLTERFGDTLYNKEKLDKPLLASLIFGNEENLRFVNSIIHPLVFDDFTNWVEKHKNCPAVVAESAILFESGFYHSVDYTVNISAPLEMRIARVAHRDGLSRQAILERIKNQMSDDEKNRLADFIIINNNRISLLSQVEFLIKSLHL
jgi:dephospho-CoA kinase